jgi:zinc protease
MMIRFFSWSRAIAGVLVPGSTLGLTLALILTSPVVIALALANVASAQPAAKPAAAKPAAAARPVTDKATLARLPGVETFGLSNGLTVAVIRIDTVPSVAVELWYRVGSKDEPRDRRGLAQLTSRLMWKGSQRVRPDAHAQLIGALGGRASGGNDEDSTHFSNELPSAYLEFALTLEAERMRGLQLREPALKAEQELLVAELRQEESSPIARGLRRLLELAFTKHSYAWPSGGVISDVQATTLSDVQRFYDTYYVPNNALLVIAGDVTVESARVAVKKTFETMVASPIVRTSSADAEPALTAQRRELAAAGQLGLILLGYGVPAATHPDWAALQVAATILGSGDNSRIKQRLRSSGKDLGLDGGVSVQPREHPSLFIALAAYREAGGDTAIESALLDEISKLTLRGPSKDELRVAKTQLQARAAFALEGNEGLASQLGRSWITSDNVRAFIDDIDRIEAVKLEDIKRVLTTYLRPERSTLLAIPPAVKPAKAAKP